MQIRYLTLLILCASQSALPMGYWEKLKAMKNSTLKTARFYSNAIKDTPMLALSCVGVGLYASGDMGFPFYDSNPYFAACKAVVWIATGSFYVVTAKRAYRDKLHWNLLIKIRNEDFDSIPQIIEDGLNVNCTDIENKTPLIHILEKYNYAKELPTIAKCDQIAQLLKTKGANLNRALLYFVKEDEKENLPAFKWLLANHANTETHDGDGRTALFLAAQKNKIKYTKLLVQAGANVNAEDKDWETPLTEAAHEKCLDVSAFLILHGAKTDEFNLIFDTPPLDLNQHAAIVAQYLMYEGVKRKRSYDSEEEFIEKNLKLPEPARKALIGFAADDENIVRKLQNRTIGKFK